MSRTNLELDDELVAQAMARYGVDTKRAIVDLALRRLLGDPMGRDEALSMAGSGWDGDLEEMRDQSVAPIE